MTRAVVIAVSGLLGLSLAACQPSPITQPAAEALDAESSTGRRLTAVGLVPDAQALDLLPLVYSSRHPFAVRERAAERLLSAQPDTFWAAINTNIRRIADWPMLELLCKRAAADGRTDATPALVLSWARPSARYDDGARPERRALEQLYPQRSVTAVLWEAAAQPADSNAAKRLTESAWAVLSRTETRQALLTRLRALDNPTGLPAQLLQVSDAVDQLPRDRQELLRLHTVRSQSQPHDWQKRTAVRLQRADKNGPANLALRHLPVVDRLPGDGPLIERDALRSIIRQRLAGRRHVARGTGDTQAANIRTTPDRLADHAEALGWADLLVVLAVLDALDDPTVVASLFQQADADQSDTTTEYGGVLVWDDRNRVIAKQFEPMLRRHDQAYLASDACIRAMHTGLAHYHFHAQDDDNAAWAGPGGGDFRFADALHAQCLVFTFVDRDTLNADLYFPGQVVLDLGCLRRP